MRIELKFKDEVLRRDKKSRQWLEECERRLNKLLEPISLDIVVEALGPLRHSLGKVHVTLHRSEGEKNELGRLKQKRKIQELQSWVEVLSVVQEGAKAQEEA